MEKDSQSPQHLQKMLDSVDEENILIFRHHKLQKYGSQSLKPQSK